MNLYSLHLIINYFTLVLCYKHSIEVFSKFVDGFIRVEIKMAGKDSLIEGV